jgi:hypothetical protein
MRKVSLYVTIIMISLFIYSLMAGASTVQRVCAQIVEPHNADAMWIEPSNYGFDTNNASVGTMFNVTVAMNFTEDVFAWQVVMYYNATQLNCTRVGATAPPTSDYMAGHSTTFSKAINPGAYPPLNGSLQSVLASETASSPDFIPGPHNGTLFWAEFEILLAPTTDQNLTSKLDISTEYVASNTYVWDPTGNSLAFTPCDSAGAQERPEFGPELGPLMIAIFMISTLAVVILSKNHISKKTRIDSP